MIGHVYERRYEVVTYPSGDGWQEGWGGFAARILVNPSGSELRTEQRLFAASNGTDVDAQDEYWQYIAPRIPEWNLVVRDADGAEREVPPPAERWESLLDLDFQVMIWLRMCIHVAHLPKAIARLEGKESATDAGSTDSTRPTPIPLQNSSKPAATSSTA